MNARFVIVLSSLVALSVVTGIVVTPLTHEPYHVQDPKSVAGCYAVSVGAWETHRLRDSLAIAIPQTVALSLDPTRMESAYAPYRMYPVGLPGQVPGAHRPSDWGVSHHGGIHAHWNHTYFGLSLYLDPARGALRGSASLAVHDASRNWRYEHATVVLTRTSCPAGLLPDKGWTPADHQAADTVGSTR